MPNHQPLLLMIVRHPPHINIPPILPPPTPRLRYLPSIRLPHKINQPVRQHNNIPPPQLVVRVEHANVHGGIECGFGGAVGVVDDVGGAVNQSVVEHLVAGGDDFEADGGTAAVDVEGEVVSVDEVGGGSASGGYWFRYDGERRACDI